MAEKENKKTPNLAVSPEACGQLPTRAATGAEASTALSSAHRFWNLSLPSKQSSENTSALLQKLQKDFHLQYNCFVDKASTQMYLSEQKLQRSTSIMCKYEVLSGAARI